jgi:hypothetical protein
MTDGQKALDTLAELEQAQRDHYRQAAQPTDPKPQAPLEEQLAERLHAAQSRWLTFTDKEST